MQTTDSKKKNGFVGLSAVLIPCGARKRKLSGALQASRLSEGSQDAVAREWLVRLAQAPDTELVSAEDLYLGRPHRLVNQVAVEHDCGFFIASAGLGLVESTTRIPGYDLTLSRRTAQSVRNKVIPFLDEARWWDHVQAGPFASSIDKLVEGNGRILIALTRPYAPFVGAALSRLPKSQRERLRIFGFGIADRLPEVLADQIMRYDGARLDRLMPGTKHDAGVRALVHFAKCVTTVPLQPVATDQKRVDQLLRSVKPARRTPDRERVSDAAIRHRIRSYVRAGTSATAALKHLRAHALIACEEHRFKRLYREVSP